MATVSKCIFIDASNELSIRDVPDKYHPEGGQALIRVQYSGINPADLNHGKHLGMNNYVSGYEVCGTVIEAGPNSRYAVGDVVFGSNHPSKSKPSYYGAHQDFTILESNRMSMKITPQVPHADAAALSIMVRTASDVLLNLFGLPFPALDIVGPPAKGGLLIWGGASTVGSAGIQLAKAMGVHPILTTASPANHEALLKLGATQCFDYRDPNVVNTVQNAVKDGGYSIKYVLDTVCKEGNPGTIEQCESIVGGPDVKFAGCIPQFGNPKWGMAFADRDIDMPMHKANPEWDSRLEKAVVWAATNYGKQFRIPNVKIVKGAESGLQAIKDVNEGKISFSKVVIEHPL